MPTSRLQITSRRRSQLKGYGLTPEAYQAIWDVQNGKCRICCLPEGKKALVVDHNHETGKVRGLLCAACNVMLGMAKDSPTILLKGIQYLKGNL